VRSVIPRLETLPPAQRILWPQLSAVGSDYILYGGTALSLQVGGRVSVDFDFFSSHPLEPSRLANELPFLKGAILEQQALNTATFLIGRGKDSVAISFFGGLSFGRVSDPIRFSDNGVYAAGLLDLAAQKMRVIQQRAKAKDYQDIHKLLSEGVTLEEALGAARALFPEFNPTVSLKALSYFNDVAQLPQGVQRDLIAAASRVRGIAPLTKHRESLLPDQDSKD
jgi:nucleotidyltransferase AbiEii toxin of type IV toxin-antitoxin system